MIVKKGTILIGIFVVVTVLSFLVTRPVNAAPIVNLPVTVTQPDGTKLNLFATGDEYYNWLHDAQGYTIIQDPVSGYYVYADLVSGILAPTRFVAGRVNPALAGLRPYMNISPEQMGQRRQHFLAQTKQASGEIKNAPHSGTINNLVVFIRFSDEAEFTDATSIYTDMLNNSSVGANSLRNYYREVSYNTLTINSTLFPNPGSTVLSYQDSHARSYYQPYNVVTNPNGYQGDENGPERTMREHTLLSDAINYVNGLGQFPSGDSIDSDGDGNVDSMMFIVSGNSEGWSSLLWPHMWWFDPNTVEINGKNVKNYSFQLNSWLEFSGTGVLAHEMFHVLGAPDLYHYSSDSLQPVGDWDLMENETNPPQHMGCYMKFRYGNWIGNIPELTSPGTYTLNPLTSSTNNCKKIASPNSTTEYFVVEYRNGAGSTFESNLPGTGLLVYRINTDRDGQGNSNGPPDEVYIYRPGGTTSEIGNLYQANLSSDVGRTAINDATDPSSFLSDGSFGGLDICNIGTSNATISFDICVGSAVSISGDAGVGGAILNYTVDSTPRTTTANSRGLYSFAIPLGWSGTVTPTKLGYTFDPSSKPYDNVLVSQMSEDYAATGFANLLQDPSFEAFTSATRDNPYWTETSTNFGTPLCTLASCGNGGGIAGPQTGSVWGWFGGTSRTEIASLSQTVTIPPGLANLEFSLWIGSAGAGTHPTKAITPKSDADNEFTVKIDDATVFSVDSTQIAPYMTYALVTVDVSSFADGAAHSLMFSSSSNGQVMNYNLDDVALRSQPTYFKLYFPVMMR